MNHAFVSGIPVFSAAGPEPFSAGLVLGVGRRDEEFVTGGITHLLEHLVMHAVGRSSLDFNASVSMSSTEFTATGRPDRVAGFLHRVCELLSDPPVGRLAVEAGVLAAEEAGICHSPLAYAAMRRYGARGIGMAAMVEPAVLSITGEQVREWSGRWATRPNAAVWMTGPVPAGMDLPLPAGEPRSTPHAPQAPAQSPGRTRPVWLHHPFDEVTLTAEIPYGEAAHCALRLVRQRVEDELRHSRGLTYEVAMDSERVDGSRWHAGIAVQVRPGHVADALGALDRALLHLVEHGPDERELGEDQEEAQEYLLDPRSVRHEVAHAAEAHVRGWPWPSTEELLADSRTLTRDEVQAAAREMRAGLMFGVPEEIEPEEIEHQLPGVAHLLSWSAEAVVGTSYRRRLRGDAPRGARLVVGEDGVTLVLAPGELLTVRWDDLIGVVEDPDGTRNLVGACGSTVPVIASDWRGGAEALAAVAARVPPRLRVRADPVPDEGLPARRAG